MNGECDFYESLHAEVNRLKALFAEFEDQNVDKMQVLEIRKGLGNVYAGICAVADAMEQGVEATRENTIALYSITRAIRHSKGDMTKEQEQAFMAEVAAGIAKNTKGIIDAQKEDTTTEEK